MDDEEGLGVSIRLLQLFDGDVSAECRRFDRALILTMGDDRDVPFPQKLADALEFLRRRIN